MIGIVGETSLYATLGIVVVIALAGLVLAYIIYPRYARKKSLRLKPGDESAAPIHMNPKTNPDYMWKDEYVNGSEPNPFLRGKV